MGKKQAGSHFLSLLEHYVNVYMPQSKGLSGNTVASYKACFRLLLNFMKTEKGIDASCITFRMLDQNTISGFLDWIENVRNCSTLTRNQRLAALCAFSEYAQNHDFDAASCFRLAVARVPRKKAVGKERAFFTPEEVKLLLSLPEERTETGMRDKVLLATMYASGARAQEICDLKVGDLRLINSRYVLHILGKGRRARQVQIGTVPTAILQGYLEHRRIEAQPNRHIFSSQTHEKMSVSCVEAVFKKYVSMARRQRPDLFKETSYPPHSMRHTTAVGMLEAGVPLPVIKVFLGHAQLSTTEVYASMRQEAVNEKVRLWNESFWSPCMETEVNEKRDDIPAFLR